MASLDSGRLREIEREVKEKRTLSVKLHCKNCQEIVAERLRFEWRWYSLVAFVLAGLFLGMYAIPAIVAGAPFVLIHVHRCSKCETELLRGSYLSILRQRRKLDTLGLTYPFYSGPVLFMAAIVFSDLSAPPSWEYFKSVCGYSAARGNLASAESEFAQHFYKEKVWWGGWFLGPSAPSSPLSQDYEPCARIMMDFRESPDDRTDLYICEDPIRGPKLTLNWTVGSFLDFKAGLERMKGPVLLVETVEVVGEGVFERFPYNLTQRDGGGNAGDGFLVENQ